MTRKLGLITIALALTAGCSFHASMRTGTRTGSQGVSEGSNARSSSSGSTAQSEQQPGVRDEALAKAGGSQPAAGSPRGSEPDTSAAPAKLAENDHDRGHGNDADRVDEDNPGKSKRANKTPADTGKKHGDHDRGHGNDADRVDEDNPGKPKLADKAPAGADKKPGDHDRGHGNDADRVDEDNPGKSKGRKNK